MADLNLTDFILTMMTTHGPLALGLTLLLESLGLPIPATLLVLAAGAFARQGSIEWSTALLLGLSGAVLGDNASYALGRFARGWVQRRFGPSSVWQMAQKRFERRGALAVYVTRFLPLPLAIPTNLIAGSSGYAFRRFLACDVAGRLTGLLLCGGLGYAFGSQWRVIGQAVSGYAVWLGGVAVAGIGIYFLLCRLCQDNRSRAIVLQVGSRCRRAMASKNISATSSAPALFR